MSNAKSGLKFRVARFSLVAIILPVIVIGILFVTYHKRATLSDINHENMRLAEAIRDDVNNFLQAPLHTVSAVAQLSRNPDIAPQLDALMSQLAESFGFYESIMLLDESGIVRNLGTMTTVQLNRGDYLGLDLSRSEHVERARRLGTHTWSDTFISPITGEPTLSLTLPFERGLVVGNFNLSTLSRVVATSPDKTRDHIFLVNAKGRVIAHTDRNLVLQQENFSTRPVVSAGLAGHEGLYEYRAGGVELIGTVLKIPETGWLVVVEREKASVFAQQRIIERILALVLVISLLLVLLFIAYINSRVVKPVISISSASKELAGGHFPALPAYTGSYRELDELTTNFNGMSAALQQREAELQDKNVELEHEIDERMHFEEELRERNEELTSIEEELRHQLDETITVQNELLTSQMLLYAMLDNSFQFQGLLTPAGKVVKINKASIDFIGVPKETVIGCNFWETPWWSHDPVLQIRIEAAVRQAALGETVHLEVTHLDVAGSLHVIEFSLKPSFNAEGLVVYLIPEGHDITDRRLLEQQIMQQQKLEGIGLLAGGIAHDFNNLLTPIFGYADMIRNKFEPVDPVHIRAAAILEAATKAKDLVKQLLSFSRKQMLSTQQYDLNVIVESFMTIPRRTMRENIAIDLLLCAERCPVQADRTQIEQILLNLAVNAQDAIAANGRITIETGHLTLDDEYCRLHPGASPGRYILLAFSDTGSGMDDATLAHIFDPFFTTKPAGHGTGLGLSTVYGIVKQHEGCIDVRSTPGHGTTFRIYLPECAGPAETETKSAAEKVAAQGTEATGTILLVEDNSMVMEMVRELLEMHGYQMLCAMEPDAAIELARANATRINLLISDVIMPQMNGPELYGRLSEIIPGLKVLFMSGYANNLSVHDGFLEEGVNFIAKPFTSEVFLGKIAGMLARNGD
ncbi:MAG: response regulator [Verrucomicrobia bacterium]|nr:response regulator [Deltaproteobacteria bacterium]